MLQLDYWSSWPTIKIILLDYYELTKSVLFLDSSLSLSLDEQSKWSKFLNFLVINRCHSFTDFSLCEQVILCYLKAPIIRPRFANNWFWMSVKGWVFKETRRRKEKKVTYGMKIPEGHGMIMNCRYITVSLHKLSIQWFLLLRLIRIST